VYFPRGGTGELVRGLVRLFEDLGGEVRLSNAVERIETKPGRVCGVACSDGWRMPADIVVSNADVVHTYDKLLATEPLAQAKSRSLHRRRYSMSLFVLYFGTRKAYPDLAHHSVLFGNRYQELLADIFKRGVLADDFSLYLHAPCVTDSSLAPKGSASFYVLSPVPHLGKADIDWAVTGPRYRDRILEHLERRCMPGLRENLVTTRIFTPLDFCEELNAHLGSAFSLEPILTQSAWFRVHNRDAKIGGLYFVGAGTHPGAGIPGVVGSAKATAGLVLSDLGIEADSTA
jgi:phytoene desaturase